MARQSASADGVHLPSSDDDPSSSDDEDEEMPSDEDSADDPAQVAANQAAPAQALEPTTWLRIELELVARAGCILPVETPRRRKKWWRLHRVVVSARLQANGTYPPPLLQRRKRSRTSTFKEAMRSGGANQWKLAMESELESMRERGV
jgi:hypothetical protein